MVLLFALPAASQDLDALFDEGVAAVEAAGTTEGDRRDVLLDRAITVFHEMLVADPRLVRVRLELARAFFLKSEDRLARQHFEHVLAGGVPPPVAANVRRFLAEIRARRRWSMHAGFALAPDTNIGASSGSVRRGRPARRPASLHLRRPLAHQPGGEAAAPDDGVVAEPVAHRIGRLVDPVVSAGDAAEEKPAAAEAGTAAEEGESEPDRTERAPSTRGK